jgi:hypothetical protein
MQASRTQRYEHLTHTIGATSQCACPVIVRTITHQGPASELAASCILRHLLSQLLHELLAVVSRPARPRRFVGRCCSHRMRCHR